MDKIIDKIMNNGYIKNNNYSVVEMDKYYAKLKAKITESSLNPYGMCHGGFIFGLADTAAGVCSSSDGRESITMNSNINYLKPSKGKYLIAEANALKVGKKTAIIRVDVFDENNIMTATALFNYFYLNS